MKSAAERKRASRLRARSDLTTADRAWLADYDRTLGKDPFRAPRAPATVAAPAPAPAPATATVAAPATAPASDAVTDDAPAIKIDFGEPAPEPVVGATPQTPPPAQPSAIKCGCSACKRRAQGVMIKCAVTGEEVYPALSLDGARGIAGGLFGVVSFGARVVRGVDVKPEKHEVDAMARALMSMAERRTQVSWIGAWDDLFALAFVMISFLARVWSAPRLTA